MLRHQPRHEPSRVSDVELGIAALVLLFVVVLAVVFIPAVA